MTNWVNWWVYTS